MGCLHDPANVQQTSSKCIQNTRANAGRLLDRVNTLLITPAVIAYSYSWASVFHVHLCASNEDSGRPRQIHDMTCHVDNVVWCDKHRSDRPSFAVSSSHSHEIAAKVAALAAVFTEPFNRHSTMVKLTANSMHGAKCSTAIASALRRAHGSQCFLCGFYAR